MSATPAVLPCLLFPNRSWWAAALQVDGPVLLSTGAPLRNTAYRNRYRIATANGPLLLSVPVIGGRRHETPLRELQSDDRQDWQRRHWRTLFSAYGRAPFWEYLGPELEALIMEPAPSMAERNIGAIRWMARCMRLSLRFEVVESVPDAAKADYLRLAFGTADERPPYRQVFDERLGFLPGLSALDLLMMQGNRSADKLLAG